MVLEKMEIETKTLYSVYSILTECYIYDTMVTMAEVYPEQERTHDHERYAIHDGPGRWTYTLDRAFALQAAQDGHEVIVVKSEARSTR